MLGPLQRSLNREGTRISICARSKHDLDQVVRDFLNGSITAIGVRNDVAMLD
jgi:hypothetical protein